MNLHEIIDKMRQSDDHEQELIEFMDHPLSIFDYWFQGDDDDYPLCNC